jgi:hypothetical protein
MGILLPMIEIPHFKYRIINYVLAITLSTIVVVIIRLFVGRVIILDNYENPGKIDNQENRPEAGVK